MARRGRESLLDDDIMQELHVDQLSDAPSGCESDKSSNYDEDDVDFGSSTSQKGRKRARLEVSDLDVNIVDADDDGAAAAADDDDDDDDGWNNNDDFEKILTVFR
jgi:hypothetical protein